MTTINGRRVKLLERQGEPIGVVHGWKQESDWVKVTTDDGVTYMVHYTDKIEILRPQQSTETIMKAFLVEMGHFKQLKEDLRLAEERNAKLVAALEAARQGLRQRIPHHLILVQIRDALGQQSTPNE